MEDIPESAGRTSYNLIREEPFFKALGLKPGMTVLDLACGVGNYSLAAAQHICPAGKVHAFDLWEEGVEILETRAAMAGITNISAVPADIAEGLPLGENSVDLCLMATILHIMIDEQKADRMLREVLRVLKPAGIIAVVEFKKIEGPPGPPLSLRHEPADLARFFALFGLYLRQDMEIGPYNYLALFSRA